MLERMLVEVDEVADEVEAAGRAAVVGGAGNRRHGDAHRGRRRRRRHGGPGRHPAPRGQHRALPVDAYADALRQVRRADVVASSPRVQDRRCRPPHPGARPALGDPTRDWPADSTWTDREETTMTTLKVAPRGPGPRMPGCGTTMSATLTRHATRAAGLTVTTRARWLGGRRHRPPTDLRGDADLQDRGLLGERRDADRRRSSEGCAPWKTTYEGSDQAAVERLVVGVGPEGRVRRAPWTTWYSRSTRSCIEKIQADGQGPATCSRKVNDFLSWVPLGPGLARRQDQGRLELAVCEKFQEFWDGVTKITTNMGDRDCASAPRPRPGRPRSAGR